MGGGTILFNTQSKGKHNCLSLHFKKHLYIHHSIIKRIKSTLYMNLLWDFWPVKVRSLKGGGAVLYETLIFVLVFIMNL